MANPKHEARNLKRHHGSRSCLRPAPDDFWASSVPQTAGSARRRLPARRAGGRKRKPGRTRCKPGSVPRRRGPQRRSEGHFSGPGLAAGICPLGRASGLPAACPSGRPGPGRGPTAMPAAHTPLLGLAPGGVCRAGGLTPAAVRSYRTVSPLPAALTGAREARRPRRRRFVFCGTVPAPRAAARETVGVTHHRGPWCSDFPPAAQEPSGERPSARRPGRIIPPTPGGADARFCCVDRPPGPGQNARSR